MMAATSRTPDQRAAMGRVFELLARAHQRLNDKEVPRRVGQGTSSPPEDRSDGNVRPQRTR